MLKVTTAIILVWMRAIRVRFLLASVIAVSAGLSLAWRYDEINIPFAIATYLGVICLHASVDLLNDYHDYKKGIDTLTRRTKFSGGTGVLPERLLSPKSVYIAGLIFLMLGSAIGIFFALIQGATIALILAFAVASIFFYSNKIVNVGLGELFVGIKGAMIVLGSFYVHTGLVIIEAVYLAIIIGILSSAVLYVTSFPDYIADKIKGRKTLVILLGRESAARIFPLILAIPYALIFFGVSSGFLNVYSLLAFFTIPLAIAASRYLLEYDTEIKMVLSMKNTVLYSRLTGTIIVISILI